MKKANKLYDTHWVDDNVTCGDAAIIRLIKIIKEMKISVDKLFS